MKILSNLFIITFSLMLFWNECGSSNYVDYEEIEGLSREVRRAVELKIDRIIKENQTKPFESGTDKKELLATCNEVIHRRNVSENEYIDIDPKVVTGSIKLSLIPKVTIHNVPGLLCCYITILPALSYWLLHAPKDDCYFVLFRIIGEPDEELLAI